MSVQHFLENARWRRAQMAEVRIELNRRRAVGLRRRHAEKLRRIGAVQGGKRSRLSSE